MGKINMVGLFLGCFIFISLSLEAAPADSLGIRVVDGNHFILHKVESGETIYSLSRRYKTTQDILLLSNPELKYGLRVGQEIVIPYTGNLMAIKSGTVIHKVKPSETLYGISRLYSVSVEDIKKWNNLTTGSLSVNQELKIHTGNIGVTNNQTAGVRSSVHVVARGETLYSISGKYNVSSDDLIKWNDLSSTELKIGQELLVTPPAITTASTSVITSNQLGASGSDKQDPVTNTTPVHSDSDVTTVRRVEKEGEFQKIIEKGMAQVIEGSETTKKYLALHKSAPIGTIMQVKNEMNDLVVFVRVIGKLPETEENSTLLVKISQTACDRLGIIDKRFPVQITYLP